jgi:microcystin-dependent protein
MPEQQQNPTGLPSFIDTVPKWAIYMAITAVGIPALTSYLTSHPIAKTSVQQTVGSEDIKQQIQAQVQAAISGAPSLYKPTIGEIRTFAFGPERGTLVATLHKQGWVECDGRDLLIKDFRELYKATENNWGTGSLNLTFKVPDLRGAFLRGLDSGGGKDPGDRIALHPNGATGRRVGSFQNGSVQPHSHPTSIPPFQSFSQGDAGGGSHLGQLQGSSLKTGENENAIETRPWNAAVAFFIFTGIPVE